MSAALKSGWAT